MNKAVVSLKTGLEDAETVTVAFLIAVGAAEQGCPTLMFLTKEAVRLATEGFAQAVACDGCPPLAEFVRALREGRRPAARVPDLRAGSNGRRHGLRRQRRGGWNGTHVEMDWRRCRGDLQLLTASPARRHSSIPSASRTASWASTQ